MARPYVEKTGLLTLPNESGVYFLYQDGNVLVYIGKAKSLKVRVPQHDKEKKFSRVYYEPVHYSRLRELEKSYLAMYLQEHGQLPFYNKQS